VGIGSPTVAAATSALLTATPVRGLGATASFWRISCLWVVVGLAFMAAGAAVLLWQRRKA
jgi:uncharacterized membrane protein YhiD involved in acid resistance